MEDKSYDWKAQRRLQINLYYFWILPWSLIGIHTTTFICTCTRTTQNFGELADTDAGKLSFVRHRKKNKLTTGWKIIYGLPIQKYRNFNDARPYDKILMISTLACIIEK